MGPARRLLRFRGGLGGAAQRGLGERAPYENAARGTSAAEVVLIALSAAALITAVSAARQFLRGNSARAVPMFVISLAGLAAWAIAASVVLS